MFFKKSLFCFYFFKITINSNDNQLINDYLHMLYPSLKNFIIKKEDILNKIKNTKEIKGKEIKGKYCLINTNPGIITLLEYSSEKKIHPYLNKIPLQIENYNIKILFEKNHEEVININNIIVNKNKNQWFENIKQQYKFINNYPISSFQLMNENSYILTFTQKERHIIYNKLKDNVDFLFLLYLFNNLNDLLKKDIYIYNPFTKSKISSEFLKKIIEKNIYMYILNLLYNEY